MNQKLRKKNKVLLPEDLFEKHYTGKIYGQFHEQSGVFNIYTDEMITAGLPHAELGVMSDNEDDNNGELFGLWADGTLAFTYKDEEFDVEKYSLVQNIFSRNTGILESSIMSEKEVIILGCG